MNRIRRQLEQSFKRVRGMRTIGALLAAAVSLFGGLWNATAFAQTYPTKAIRLIIPFGAGGPPDFVGRIIAQHLAAALGQQVIVDNRPGAGGTIGAAAAAKSPGDGYTLFFATTSTLSIAPSLYANPGFDPRTSFAPISLIATAPFLIVVHPSLPTSTLKELIALARSRPGQLYFSSGGNGTPLHIAGEMFKASAGVNLVHVPYKEIAPATTDLLAGRVQIMFQQLATLDQHIRSGKLRPLAVASPKRHPQLPDLPTTSEAGLSDYEVTVWFGLVAPSGTPADAVKRLNVELMKVLQTKEVRDGLSNQGLQTAGNSPEEFSAFITRETAKWSAAVKRSGARID